MLIKLIKHEYKATYKMFLSSYIGVFLITLFTILTNTIDLFDNTGFSMLRSLFGIAFVLSFFALPIGSVIYIIYRFYKNLFTDEGYLMFTLPVSRIQLILSKFIVSCTWLAGSILLLFGDILLYMNTDDTMKAFVDFMKDVIDEFVSASFADMAYLYFFIILYIVAYIVSLISFLYMALSFGQLIIPNHKILGAFLAYIALNFVQEIISFITLTIYTQLTDYTFTSEVMPSSYLLVSSLLSFALTALWLFLSNLICSKKLNLS